jgi:exodeoxyribonuclease V alpha subunit
VTAEWLDPRGPVATRLGLVDLLGGEAAHHPWPAERAGALAALDGLNLGEEELFLAWDLARRVPDLSSAEERAALLLVLAVQLAGRLGSTHLPTSGAEGTAHLEELATALGADREEVALARTLLAEVREARLSGGRSRLDALVGLPGERRPFLLDGYSLYEERMLRAEERVAQAVRARLEAAPMVERAQAEAALADVLARPAVRGGTPVRLTDEQRAAVEATLVRPLTVIAGGPGTGKTSIVAALLRALARLGVEGPAVALAAPTGRAADRMRQALDDALAAIADPGDADRALSIPEAQTLHRLLGWNPTAGRFRHHAGNPLPYAVVLVDEASMIDLLQMDRLLAALPATTRLVLLGDPDQLPSVDAGSVLRDLLGGDAPLPAARSPRALPTDRRLVAAARLTESFRMSPSDPAGRHVLLVARRVAAGLPIDINSGAPADELPRHRRSAEELELVGVELLDSGDGERDRAAFLDRWWERRRGDAARAAERDALLRRTFVRDRAARERGGDGFDDRDRAALLALFAESERMRLVTFTRADAAEANAALHARAVAALRERQAADGAEALRSAAMVPGEPVLVTENDHARALYNGDQGLVLRVSDDGAPHHFMAVFRRGDTLRAFSLESLRGRLDLAYAVTVHKSQGSEHDLVGLLVPPAGPVHDSPLASRELVYTALTRARRGVVIVGDSALFARAAARKTRRFSRLGARIVDG